MEVDASELDSYSFPSDFHLLLWVSPDHTGLNSYLFYSTFLIILLSLLVSVFFLHPWKFFQALAKILGSIWGFLAGNMGSLTGFHRWRPYHIMGVWWVTILNTHYLCCSDATFCSNQLSLTSRKPCRDHSCLLDFWSCVYDTGLDQQARCSSAVQDSARHQWASWSTAPDESKS